MEKRGISDVITTVLIILLALAAIVIVWQVVKKTVTDASGQIGIEKFSVGLSTQTVNLTADPVRIPVSRSAGQGNLSAIKIVFKDAVGVSIEYTNTTAFPEELGTFTYVISQIFFNGFVPVSFDVYPILKVNGKDVVGIKASVSGGGGGGSSGGGTTPPSSQTTYYRDFDEDNYGNPLDSKLASSQPAGYVLDNTDCNDNNGAINPGATENPSDDVDNNCDNIFLMDHCSNDLNVTGATYILTKNIAEPEIVCFTIDAEGITLDLNGFNITKPAGVIGNIGVYLYVASSIPKANSATVKNGGIYSYGQNGIDVGSNSNVNIIDIVANNNGRGISISTGSGNTLTRVTANSNTYRGIGMSGSSNTQLRDVTANSNTNYGIYLGSASGIIITNSKACSNGVNDLLCSSSSANSGTGNIFGSGNKVIYCLDGWPEPGVDYTAC